jgi:GT2 family glycosyltransferase
MTTSAGKDISVVIPTFNRAALLRRVLDSLTRQSISRERYEVIVVDDGSSDNTSDVCKEMTSHLSLTYLAIDHGGISAAKNAGLAAAAAPIVLFFDDDDVAEVNLLGEHLRTHAEYPEENVAVLGFTTWHPLLTVTPFMEWLTDVGQFLLAYQGLTDGATLPYKYFWGGRASCKASLLSKHGAFDERFRFAEDIELAYRLSRHGLSVVFNKAAASYMIRPVTVDAQLKRCERAGEALALFSRIHPDPEVAQYCSDMGATLPWDDERLAAQVRRTAQLESELELARDVSDRQGRLWELWDLYWWVLSGTVSRAFARTGGIPPEESADATAVGPQQRLESLSHRRAGEAAAQVHELRERAGKAHATIRDLQEELHAKVGDRDRTIRVLQEELQAKIGERDRTIQALQEELNEKVGERDRMIQDLQEELHAKVGDRDRTILTLSAELFEKVGERDTEIRRLQQELESRR